MFRYLFVICDPFFNLTYLLNFFHVYLCIYVSMHLFTIKMSFASVHFATFLIYLNVFYLSTNLFFHSVFLVGLLILFTFEMRITKEHIQVEPGKPGAEVSKRKKNYTAKKEFAYRMRAKRPTSALPKPFLCCEPAFCCSMVVM